MHTLITTEVDYERDGKQNGFLNIPQSTNTSGWRTEYLPVPALSDGMVMGLRAWPKVDQGDCLGTIVRPFQF